MINNIHHLNIPALTTSVNGTSTLLPYGGANADWVEASGVTYNSVEKIDTIISTIQGQLPAKIIFTTTLTYPPDVSWTVPASVNSVTIEASGAGASGTPAIAMSTSGVYQGGGSGQVGNITVPVAEGMVLNISLILRQWCQLAAKCLLFMNSSSSGTGGMGSTSFFNGTASAEWGSGNSGNGGLIITWAI